MGWHARLRQGLREPLVHFLLAGSAIFLFFGTFGGEPDLGSRRISVNEYQVKRLATQWAQVWQRAPSANELDGLIRDYIKEEIYYREALRLGLDKDDMVVRRRLRSKMEFLATSETENMIATDADLQAWLDKYPARYAADPLFSLDQVYVNSSEASDTAAERAEGMLIALRAGADPRKLGDMISLPQSLDNAPGFEVERQFGGEFVAALKPLAVGVWSGPVPSGFGLHLVRIRKLTTKAKPKLPDVRKQVENDWRDATRERRETQAYQALLDSYQIDIERPK